MDWDNLKVFLAIADAGGLKRAAQKLGMHHTSCARRIKQLEEQLDIRLFDRRPSGYVLTQAGQQLKQSAQIIQQEFYRIECDLLGQDLRLEGDLCLTLPNGFATHLLMPDIRDFMQRYPDVNLEVNMSYTFRDLASREADVAIRHMDNPPDSLTGKRLTRLYRSAYASEEYLAQYDPVNNPQDCHWLGWGDSNDQLSWAEKSKYPEIPVRGNLYSDVLQLTAVQENIGIASLPCFIADPIPQLQRVPNSEIVAGEWIWVLAHKDMASNAKVRALIDFIVAAFKRHESLIEGRSIAVN